ncbi:MAG: hypothetical protein QME63_09620 [Actinomycetota bacterium]|nr:hypothetical protein [Actinomycetota bacterium]
MARNKMEGIEKMGQKNIGQLLKEYKELEKKASMLKGELRCRHDCAGLCATIEVAKAKQQLIDITLKMDEINEALGRDKKVSYH